MMIDIKNKDDQEKMRIAGKLASQVLDMISNYVAPGITTGELDRICHDYIVNEQNAIPANLNYKGFSCHYLYFSKSCCLPWNSG